LDADDGDDLFELFAHLLEGGIVAGYDESHARQIGVFGLADRKAVNIEAARGQHTGNVSQDPRLVLYQRRKHVPHRFLFHVSLPDHLALPPTASAPHGSPGLTFSPRSRPGQNVIVSGRGSDSLF